MEDGIKELLSLVRKERIIITKMVEADEREDKMLFNGLQKPYKEISLNVDKLINSIINQNRYDKEVEFLSNKISNLVDDQKDAGDYITLLGLINTFYLNKKSNEKVNSDSDAFSNEYVLQIYDIYLWMMKNKEKQQEFDDSIRTDLVAKLANSRSMRKYFAGNYEDAMEYADPLIDKRFNDRNRLGTVYSSLMMAQINLSNKFEMFDGIFDEISFESRKRLFEVEFAAISVILAKRGFLIPPNAMEYSDFTEEIIRNASKLVDDYNNKETKEDNKILLKKS